VLVLDALNEGPFPEEVTRQALGLIQLAAHYPWCKVVVSTRLEWLGVFAGRLEAQETDPLEAARPYLYVLEPARAETRQTRQGPPVVQLEPLTEGQAEAVYGHYQEWRRPRSQEEPTRFIPACLTAWTDLPPATRTLLLNPLHLNLFMEAFDGRHATAVATLPALFRLYVDRAVGQRPGLRRSLGAVVENLLANLGRASADLDDDDANAIRRRWAAGLSDVEARIRLSPVEALVNEGWLRKRVREEGGGYRFVFQTVAEYLIYRHLADTRPEGEEEQGYWQRRAAQDQVFAEYAGAFGFLLRDWVEGGTPERIGALVEASPDWLGEVATAFLTELPRLAFVPGQVSTVARDMADALERTAGVEVADVLAGAGFRLMNTCFAPTAMVYFLGCRRIVEALYAANPENVGLGDGLAGALSNLGMLLSDGGQTLEADGCYRRSLEIREALYASNPENLGLGDGLARALNNLGNLLSFGAQTREAEACYRRSVEVSQALYAANPENVGLGTGLAGP